ncbi:MAG: UDP-N-acetylmuramate dehydrogenase [Acidimicrobiales bacterium]
MRPTPAAARAVPDPARACREVMAALAARVGPRARLGAPLGARTTYRVGGDAALLVDVENEADLVALQEALSSLGAAGQVPVLVLGNGSNLLVADSGFAGVVVRPGGELASLEVLGARDPGEAETAAVVRTGAALGLPVLARRTVEAGLRGLEWAVGVPGTVGGALKMNAGGHGADTASCLLRYRSVDLAGGGPVEADAARLDLSYRNSSLGDAEVVVWAELAARRGDAAEGRRVISEIVRWRREHQPGGSNAGSVFTNPPGDSAGRLVESAGLKGFRLGTARVSDKHANFIQADEGGRAADVVALMTHVRRTVSAATGVLLRPEVKLVGFGQDPLAGDGPAPTTVGP